MTDEPVRLSVVLADTLLGQFKETVAARGWSLSAAAVMATHVHVVVGVRGDPAPDAILRDFKAYASRALNAWTGQRRRWWTQSGSKRKLADEAAVRSAVGYVRDQRSPLVTWADLRFAGERQERGDAPAG